MPIGSCISTLKNLAKISSFKERKNIIKLTKEPSFRSLLDKLYASTEFLSEQEVLDVCFFIRKLNSIGLNKILNQDFKKALREKITSLISGNRADFKFLSNVYFDLGLSEFNVDYVAKALC